MISAEPHPQADRLKVCQVETSQGPVQVVCGAPNARTGMLGVFAPVGTVIPRTKMLLKETKVDPENARVVRLARKFYPVAPHLDGHKFMTIWQAKPALTPLALVLLLVETTDLIFAVDSIPAIFAVTTKPFIVFTSNVFAILGLRSLYFVLVGAIGYFRYLKPGLSIALVFVGVKMLLDPHDREPPLWFQVEIPISISLLVIAGIILGSIVLSVVAAEREKKQSMKKKRK